MNRKCRIAAIMIVCMLVFGGCAIGGKSNEDQDNIYLNSYRVQLYYASAAYVETGDEDLPKMQEPFEVKIRSLPKDVYADTIEYLKHPPADQTYVTMVPKELVINSVEIEEGTATVDLSGKDLSGGSMQEMFLIAQIVNSLLTSFEEIDRVQFTVDGAIVDTLMGHVMALDPFLYQDF